MRFFCAQSKAHGVQIDHTYESPSYEQAEKIAKSMGWEFLGEMVCESIVYSDEDMQAIVSSLRSDSVH